MILDFAGSVGDKPYGPVYGRAIARA